MKGAFYQDLARTYRIMDGGRLRRALACARAPGIHAVAVYRLGHWAARRSFIARLLLEPLYAVLNLLLHVLWGIEISRHASIGPGLYIGHFGGIVIGRDAVIGANCNLSHGVTIGAGGSGAGFGTPRIGDDAYIASGACLFGRISVGDNVKIGPNTVVHRDLPDDAVVALDPGYRIISMRGNRMRRAVNA